MVFERLLLWTPQESLYTYSKIIHSPLQSRFLELSDNHVVKTDGPSLKNTGRTPHDPPLHGLALADHPGRYCQNGLKVVQRWFH